MPYNCAVFGCKSASQSTRSFFGFPLNNPGLTAKWQRALNRRNFVYTKYSKVCDRHFKREDILRDFALTIGGKEVRVPRNRPILKRNVVPSIFPVVKPDDESSEESETETVSTTPAENTSDTSVEESQSVESSEATVTPAVNGTTDEESPSTENSTVPMKRNITSVTQMMAEKVNRVYKKLQTDKIIGLDKLQSIERNAREGRGKLVKKTTTEVVRSMYRYDSKGVLIRAQRDLCDCLNENCPGCHWPCRSCRSTKCGPECRCNRRWVYEQVEVEGTDIVLHTPLKTRTNIGGYQYYH